MEYGSREDIGGIQEGAGMKKILVTFGTRPEAIKLAPLIMRLKKEKSIKLSVCVTGQHRHMLDQVLSAFKIRPDFDMDVMTKDQAVEGVITKVLFKMGKILDAIKPDIVVVQGDTTTAFAISLAAFLRKIKIAHIEAGLRSHDKHRPFPEEANRRLISHIADLHFAPTAGAAMNLVKENIDKKTIFVTGNTGIDALLMIARKKKAVLPGSLRFLDRKKRLILVTAHRRESFGKPLREICMALKNIADVRKDVEIVYPVHLNPSVKKTVYKMIKGKERIQLIDPLSYEEFVHAMKLSYLILTDSGGIQEEAPSLKKPVLVMREVTERQEGIKAGCARLVGLKQGLITKNVIALLENKKLYNKMSSVKNPYGDGNAAGRIAGILKKA